MKISQILSILFLATITFGIQQKANAQIIDSLPYFKTNLLLDIDGKIELKGAFIIPKMSQSKIKQISFSSSAKTKMAKTSVHIINGPIVLKRGQRCYKFSCVPRNNCTNCKIYWWDKNGDGKIQPRRELRCGCSGMINQCKMKVELIDCP